MYYFSVVYYELNGLIYMIKTNRPFEEIKRLDELASYFILDTEAESDFDNITQLIAEVCKVPVATISLIDETRDWHKSTIGVDYFEVERNISLSSSVIKDKKPLIIEDASKHPDFCTNPLVAGSPHIRFFAGAPLISPAGHVLGTLAIIDFKARKLSQSQLSALFTLASQVIVLLEKNRQNHALINLNQELKLKTKELEKKTEFLSAVLENLSEGIVACDENGKLSHFNRATRELHGVHESSLPPEEWAKSFDLFMPDGKTVMQPEQIPLYKAFLGEKISEEKLVIAPKNQLAKTVLCNGQPIITAKGEKLGAVVAMRDISSEQAFDIRLRQQASLLDKAQDAILVRNLNHQVLYWNKSAELLYGWTAAEALNSTALQLIYKDTTEFYKAHHYLLDHGEWSGELEQKRKDGSMMTISCHWTLVRNDLDEPESVLCINTDITSRKIAQDKIQLLAFYDSLTLLPNRQLLIDRLNQLLVSRIRHSKNGALFFIDLDNFKSLNDTLGHDVGDLLLKEVAKRISNCIRSVDTVARFGGDEFVVMITELNEDLIIASEQAKIITNKLSVVINQSYQLGNHVHFITPSIGITLIDKEVESVEQLLKQADLAMYQAKSAGRNTFRFYHSVMQTDMSMRVSLEEDLRQGLSQQQFLLHYQPQLNHLHQIEGAEALIRWTHPVRGPVSPAEFIPIAESTQLILPIGEWVLRTTCLQLVEWAKLVNTANLIIAVNISIFQLRQQDFVQRVLQIIEETGANPERLKLEITEGLFVDNVEDVIVKMDALKAKGIKFSLDDFGTGYSSLSYLKRLPLDQLKIDQSFVRDILIDSNDASIAQAIITLGQNLGLNVIAEGVETEEQRQFLLDNHCLSYQGYLFSKPLTVEKFEEYVTNNKAIL